MKSIADAFAQALIKQADHIVLAVLVLVFCTMADRLFRATFRSLWQGFLGEVSHLAQLKFSTRAINLIGGILGVVFFVLLIATDSIFSHLFKVDGDINVVAVTCCAAFTTWIYFLLSITFCKGSR